MRWWRVASPSRDALGLALCAEEGFVLSRLDVPVDERELGELTGLPPDRIAYIVALLDDKGLIEGDTPSMRPEARTIPDAEYDHGEPVATSSEPIASSTTKPILDAVAALAAAHDDDPAVLAGAEWVRARYAEAGGEVRARRRCSVRAATRRRSSSRRSRAPRLARASCSCTCSARTSCGARRS